ncbi:MAG: hypothetical protein C4523_06170 [Myxococcales bacterium]|nr:MAG: hypothetical protein C4523_06170 [Myxococcales bacterium]
MKNPALHFGIFAAALVLTAIMLVTWINSASARLADVQAEKNGQAAVAAAADEGYCSGALRPILRRVLTSCGLLQGGQSGRGCQPLQAKSVAAMSGDDFNALFKPLAHRAAIIQFAKDSAELDPNALALVEKTFADQRGASYFLVVSRASPEGSAAYNAELSKKRANAVLGHLRQKFNDPDLDQEVGLLWLGEEFAQLDEQFCQWTRSAQEQPCATAELNRSAFLAWIDCRL